MLIPGNVVFLDSLRMMDITEGRDTLGKFINQRIYLLEEREGIYSNVVRHEAFHKIVSYYLTAAERKTLFKTARAKYKLDPSLSDVEVGRRLFFFLMRSRFCYTTRAYIRSFLI